MLDGAHTSDQEIESLKAQLAAVSTATESVNEYQVQLDSAKEQLEKALSDLRDERNRAAAAETKLGEVDLQLQQTMKQNTELLEKVSSSEDALTRAQSLSSSFQAELNRLRADPRLNVDSATLQEDLDLTNAALAEINAKYAKLDAAHAEAVSSPSPSSLPCISVV